MNRQEAIGKAKQFFENDDLLKVLHFTTDGQAFPIENRAQVHQRELTQNIDGIVTVKRDEAIKEEMQSVVVDNKTDDVVKEKTEEVKEEVTEEVKEEKSE